MKVVGHTIQGEKYKFRVSKSRASRCTRPLRERERRCSLLMCRETLPDPDFYNFCFATK